MVMALQQSLLVVFTVISFYCPLPFTCTGSATANYELKWYFLALHQVSGFIVCVCVCFCCIGWICVCVVHVESVSRRFRPVKGAKKRGMDILCTQCPIGSANYGGHTYRKRPLIKFLSLFLSLSHKPPSPFVNIFISLISLPSLSYLFRTLDSNRYPSLPGS